MPEVPPVIRIVLDCIFISVFPYNPRRSVREGPSSGSEYSTGVIWSSIVWSSLETRGEHHVTLAAFAGLFDRMPRGSNACDRAAIRSRGRQELPAETLSQNGRLGLLRRKSGAGAAN